MDPVTIARLPKCSAGTVGNPNVFGIDSITWLDSATTHEFCRDSHNETGGVSSKSPAHQVSSDPPKPLKALNKSSVQTLLPLKQREQQSEMQIFLDRRAALWPACSRPAANAKSSKSPLCDCMPKSSHRRHHVCVADIEVSRSDSLGLSEEEIIVPPSQTWKQSLCHFFGGAGR